MKEESDYPIHEQHYEIKEIMSTGYDDGKKIFPKKEEFDFLEMNDEPITKKSRQVDANNPEEGNINEMKEKEGMSESQKLLPKRKEKSLYTKIQEKIVGTVLSEETIDALRQVFQIYQTFTKELQGYSILSILMACKIIALYDEGNERITTGEIFEDLDEIKVIQHWWKYTSASFGWQFNLGYKYEKKLSGLISGFVSDTNKINKKIVMESVGINEEDILITKWNSELLTPGYYLAVDHNKKCIVVVIRGSFELKDAIPDLIGKKVEFLGGGVHEGFLIATKKVKEILEIKFRELREKHPEYKVICTGHSLGGACAAIYTMMLLDEYKNKIDVHAYAFGCPSLVTLDLALKYKPYITSIIYNYDMVPRTSYGSLEDLKFKVVNILEHTGFFGRTFQILNGMEFFDEESKKKYEKILKTPSQPNFNRSTKPRHSLRLWPPGFIINMHKDSDDKIHFEKSHPSLFSNMIISNRMVADHIPDKYEEAIINAEKSILEDLEALKIKKKRREMLENKLNNNFYNIKVDNEDNISTNIFLDNKIGSMRDIIVRSDDENLK
eukprot:TRINITY_DN2953_c0_g1_i1.p1 TRINITY_DN2953_c0_g1~~TRINITY_DN2953_c0_g1_i1.p1  ORF type:complete len:554 (+),score=155.12 TRINITY_DN2953_c0_g1_i1:42-1703(+)